MSLLRLFQIPFMSLSHPIHVPLTSLSCPSHVPPMSLSRPSHIPLTSLSYPSHIPLTSLLSPSQFYCLLKFLYPFNSSLSCNQEFKIMLLGFLKSTFLTCYMNYALLQEITFREQGEIRTKLLVVLYFPPSYFNFNRNHSSLWRTPLAFIEGLISSEEWASSGFFCINCDSNLGKYIFE